MLILFPCFEPPRFFPVSTSVSAPGALLSLFLPRTAFRIPLNVFSASFLALVAGACKGDNMREEDRLNLDISLSWFDLPGDPDFCEVFLEGDDCSGGSGTL